MSTQKSAFESEPKYNDVINKLQDYMLNENTIKRSLHYRLNNRFENNTEQTNKIYSKPQMTIVKDKCNTFTPVQKDTLFWCFYILKYGEHNYEMLDNINIVLEKKLKIDYVEKIRKDKQIVKSYKFATLTHLENQLANEDKIDLNTFFTLAATSGVKL